MSTDTVVPHDLEPSRIRRWWAFPTRLLILVAIAWWVVPWLWERVPHVIEYVVARNTPGELTTTPACSFAIFPRRFTVQNLHWQHQEHDGFPSRVNLDEVTVKFSPWELLFRRVKIDYASLDGVVIEWNDPLHVRWAKHLLGNTDGRSFGTTTTSDSSRPILREEFVFLLGGRPDMITPLVAEQFRSHTVAESLKQKWLPEWNALRQRSDALAARWNRLRERLADPANSGATIPELIDEGGKLLLELNQIATDFDRLAAQSGNDLQQLQAALREDRRRIDSLAPPAIAWDAVIRQLFGEEWLQSAEKTLIQTAASKITTKTILPPVLPPISVDRLDTTGKVMLAGDPVYFRATLRNGVVPSKRRVAPIEMQCCLDIRNIPDVAAFTAPDTAASPLYVSFIADDTVTPPVERFTFQQPRYSLPELSLGDEQTLNIVLAPMTVSVDATLERRGDTATLVVKFFGDNARITPHLPPQVITSEVGKNFEESLAAVRHLSGELRIETVPGASNIVTAKTSFKSNLTDAIAKTVDTVIENQWGTLKQSLSTWLDDTATAAIAEATPRDVNDRLEQLRGQLSTAIQPLGARDALNAILRLAPGLVPVPEAVPVPTTEPLVPLK